MQYAIEEHSNIKLAFEQNKIADKDKFLNSPFLKTFEKTIDEVKNKLNLGDNFQVALIVLPAGEKFERVSRQKGKTSGLLGVVEPEINNNEICLLIDEEHFFKKYPEGMEYKAGLVHELGHVIHSRYFSGQLGWAVSEGFSEIVAHYLTASENSNPEHRKAIALIQEDQMLSADRLNKNNAQTGSVGLPQFQNTYLSAYLWMLGYIKRFEKKVKLPKVKSAKIMLNKFSQIAKNTNEEEKIKELSKLIGIQPDTLMHSTDLQKEGKAFLMQRWQQKKPKTLHTTPTFLQSAGR